MNESYAKDDNVPTAYSLWRYLDHARYMVFRLRERELAQLGLTPEQAQVLDIICAAGGSTNINYIVRSTQRQHNSMSTLIARMTRQGLVKKTRTRRDKRAYRITMTEKGMTAYLNMSGDSIEQSFSSLSDVDKSTFFKYLIQLLVHVYEMSGLEFYSRFDSENNNHSSKSQG